MKTRMVLCHLATAVGAAGLLVSCDQVGDPGIKEKVALLEAELRNRDGQLVSMQEEIAAKVSEAAPSAGPDLPAATAAYLGYIEAVRKQLADALPNAKFDRTSVFPVVGPDPEKPITSSVGFQVVRPDGKTGEIKIPLSADAAGEWQPLEAAEVAKIVAQLKAKPAVAAAAAPPPSTQPTQPANHKPADVLGANRTVDVDWGDAPQPPPGKTTTAAPQEAPPTPPPAGTLPKKVMPTSRDVIIDFD